MPVNCEVAVRASGVIAGGTLLFEDVKPLQADSNNSSKHKLTQITSLPVDLLVLCFTGLRDREEKMHVIAILIQIEINTHAIATNIL